MQALGRARLRLIENAAFLGRRAIILREQLGKLAKRGQRRPEFMRHGGDEIRLKPGDSHFTIHRAPDEIAPAGDQNHQRRKTDCEIAASCDEFLRLRSSGRAQPRMNVHGRPVSAAVRWIFSASAGGAAPPPARYAPAGRTAS